MANVSRVRGFMPVQKLGGAPYTGSVQEFIIIGANEATAVFIGDVVEYGVAGGAAGLQISGRDVEGIASVVHSNNTTAGDGLAGVVVGFIQDEALPKKYNPVSTNRIVLVETARDVVYEVQEDGVGNNIAAAEIGANIAMVSGAGSTVTGASAYAIDSSDTATTSTYPWRLLGLVKRPDNNYGASTTDLGKFLVVMNTMNPVGI